MCPSVCRVEDVPERVLQEHEEEPVEGEDHLPELPVEVEEVSCEDVHVEEVHDLPCTHTTPVLPSALRETGLRDTKTCGNVKVSVSLVEGGYLSRGC